MKFGSPGSAIHTPISPPAAASPSSAAQAAWRLPSIRGVRRQYSPSAPEQKSASSRSRPPGGTSSASGSSRSRQHYESQRMLVRGTRRFLKDDLTGDNRR